MVNDFPFAFTEDQEEFASLVLAGHNVFLTGKAGTGKTSVSVHVIQALRDAGKKVIALAPTGVAATNIGGQTIHSMFALNPFAVLTRDNLNFLAEGTRKLLRVVDTIVFDEVSMLRPDILDACHWTLIKNGLAGLDKRQIIFIGDMKQLRSIIDDNFRTIMYRIYDGAEFTNALIYESLNVITCELQEVQRQTDREFIDALNLVRDGKKSPYFHQFITTEPRGVILAPHNATVKQYNADGLRKERGELHTFEALMDGNERPEDFPMEMIIEVKEGSPVMYLVNSADNPLHNGTIGTFMAYDGKYFIRVGTIDYALEPVTISKKKYIYNKGKDAIELQEIGAMTQYPIKLAYALSIHKAQGLTFDTVTVDIKRQCFQEGQLYVAFSRVRTPGGLSIITK